MTTITPTDAPRSDGRTHYEAVLDVRYGVHFNELCERYYNRVDGLISVVTVGGSAGAVVSLLQANAFASVVSGAVLAIITVLGQVIGPARKAEQHRLARRQYALIDVRASGLTLEAIDQELRVLQAEAPTGIAMLAVPAQNAMLRSNGCADRVQPETRGHRWAMLLA